MRKTALFLLPVKNLTTPSCSPTQISYKPQEFWRFRHKYAPNCIFFIAHAQHAQNGLISTFCQTRNTFCGTWYLPHSRVHKSIAELCSNFGDSAITKGQIAYFSLRMRNTVLFLLSVKIWRHRRVHRPRFPIRCRNFGDSSINMGQIVYFSLACAKRL